MKPLLGILASLSICILSFSGCEEYEPVPPPEININPNPVDGYRVLMKVMPTPEPVDVSAYVNYWIINKNDCIPIDSGRSLGGSRPSFRKLVSVPVEKLPYDEYKFIFYNDLIVSENYYGLGICEWQSSPRYRIYMSGYRYSIGINFINKSGEFFLVSCSLNGSGGFNNCDKVDLVEDRSEENNFYVEIKLNRE